MRKICEISAVKEHPDLKADGAVLVVKNVSVIERKFAFKDDPLVWFYSSKQREMLSVAAPFHGIVSEINVAARDEVTPSQKLMKITEAPLVIIIIALTLRALYELVTDLIWEVEKRLGDRISSFVEFCIVATLTILALVIIASPFYFYTNHGIERPVIVEAIDTLDFEVSESEPPFSAAQPTPNPARGLSDYISNGILPSSTAEPFTIGVADDGTILLPTTEAEALPIDDTQPITISVSADGEIFLNENQIDNLPQLKLRLQSLLNEGADYSFYLRGDRNLSMSEMNSILSAIQEAGVTNLGFVVQHEDQETAELTAGEVDGLVADIRACWNVGGLSSEAQVIGVTVRTELTDEGRVIPSSIELLDATSGSDTAIMEAFESAKRAILRCGSVGFDLPTEKYDQWRTIEMVFHPEQIRSR